MKNGSIVLQPIGKFMLKKLFKKNDIVLDNSEGERNSHRWGYKDTYFVIDEKKNTFLKGNRYILSGYPMPNLIPLFEEISGVEIDIQTPQEKQKDKKIPTPIENKRFLETLEKNFSPNQFSVDDSQRLIHSHGQTSVCEVYQVLYSQLERIVDLVFYPREEEDISKIIQFSQEHNVVLIPYGGGTNVSGALLCRAKETRMIVSVDMRSLDKILWIDEYNLQACIQAGISGKELEKQLGEKGYTLGHEPDSIEFSTLGGWISTNASGMKKNRYGNIEDIVMNATMVTPSGVITLKNHSPRQSIGLQPSFLFFGSEGNLGIITKAVVKIHPKPALTQYGSLVFPNFEQGVNFLYDLRRNGTMPASVRLVDNTQFRLGLTLKPKPSFLKGLREKLQKLFLFKVLQFDPRKLSVCTIVMEGSKEEVKQQSCVFKIARKHGGIKAGGSNGKRGYMLTFAIAYLRDFVSRYYYLGESFETSIAWDKVIPVCEALGEAVLSQHEKYKLPGKPLFSARVTQTYHTGVCLYFMYAFYHKGVHNVVDVYEKIEHHFRQVIIDHGGSISHHHGIGKIRHTFLKDALVSDTIDSLKKFKYSLDPQNTFAAGNNVFHELNQD